MSPILPALLALSVSLTAPGTNLAASSASTTAILGASPTISGTGTTSLPGFSTSGVTPWAPEFGVGPVATPTPAAGEVAMPAAEGEAEAEAPPPNHEQDPNLANFMAAFLANFMQHDQNALVTVTKTIHITSMVPVSPTDIPA